MIEYSIENVLHDEIARSSRLEAVITDHSYPKSRFDIIALPSLLWGMGTHTLTNQSHSALKARLREARYGTPEGVP